MQLESIFDNNKYRTEKIIKEKSKTDVQKKEFMRKLYHLPVNHKSLLYVGKHNQIPDRRHLYNHILGPFQGCAELQHSMFLLNLLSY